jgi:hypothetical protein
MVRDVAEIVMIGVGMAAAWFYARSLLTGDLSGRSVYRWIIIIVPQGIFIAWGLKAMGLI